MSGVVSLLSLSFELLASFWCPCLTSCRVRPQGVYGDRKISAVHPVWVSFLCIDQIEASMSSRGQTPGYLSFWTSVYANPLLLLEAKLFKCPTHPTFRKRQIRQPWLSTPRPNLRWKDLTLSVQTPHPSQAKVQIPQPLSTDDGQMPVGCPWDVEMRDCL